MWMQGPKEALPVEIRRFVREMSRESGKLEEDSAVAEPVFEEIDQVQA